MEKPAACPICHTGDTPILIVRGTGADQGGFSLKCRSCGHQWTEDPAEGRRAS